MTYEFYFSNRDGKQNLEIQGITGDVAIIKPIGAWIELAHQILLAAYNENGDLSDTVLTALADMAAQYLADRNGVMTHYFMTAPDVELNPVAE
jgi:hypothetical protein